MLLFAEPRISAFLLILIILSMSHSLGLMRLHLAKKSARTSLTMSRMSDATQRGTKITSYNVLSSSLGGSDYYKSCNPEWLLPNHRLLKLKQKLDVEIQSQAIICLQEVSTKWSGALHSYFSQHGYYMVTGCYGNKFNGYMGVAVAVPLQAYQVIDVDITRIADTKRWWLTRSPWYDMTNNVSNEQAFQTQAEPFQGDD